MEFWSAPSGASSRPQPSGLVDPAAALLRPVPALDAVAPGQQLPRLARAFEARRVEQVEAAVIAHRRLAPLTIGNQHVAGEVGGVGAGREQDRLARVVASAGQAVRKEAR